MKNIRDSGNQEKPVAGFEAVSQLWTRLGRSGLPSETLKSGSSEGGVSAGSAKGIVLKASALLLIFKRFRFKFSLERPPRP
jgi:hypothetical protein